MRDYREEEAILDGYLSHLDEDSVHVTFNGKSFIYVAAFGAFTDVSYDTPQMSKNILGNAAYLFEGIKRINTIEDIGVRIETAEGEIKLDATGKLTGRGAYICRDKECLNKARKSNALARAFETNVSEDIYIGLETELDNIE